MTNAADVAYGVDDEDCKRYYITGQGQSVMEPVIPRHTTSRAIRSKFVFLWVGGMSARAIAQNTGTSVTTVCRWITRWRTEGHVENRPKCGRPRKEKLFLNFYLACPLINDYTYLTSPLISALTFVTHW